MKDYMTEEFYLDEEMTEEKLSTTEETGEKEGKIRGFWQDNRGVGVIEIVLILVVLIGLVLIFKDQITTIVNNAFASISGNAGKIIN